MSCVCVRVCLSSHLTVLTVLTALSTLIAFQYFQIPFIAVCPTTCSVVVGYMNRNNCTRERKKSEKNLKKKKIRKIVVFARTRDITLLGAVILVLACDLCSCCWERASLVIGTQRGFAQGTRLFLAPAHGKPRPTDTTNANKKQANKMYGCVWCTDCSIEGGYSYYCAL